MYRRSGRVLHEPRLVAQNPVTEHSVVVDLDLVVGLADCLLQNVQSLELDKSSWLLGDQKKVRKGEEFHQARQQSVVAFDHEFQELGALFGELALQLETFIRKLSKFMDFKLNRRG